MEERICERDELKSGVKGTAVKETFSDGTLNWIFKRLNAT